MINLNDIVKFKTPFADEIGVTMKVIEVNGDRCFIEYLNIGMNIIPTAVFYTSDLVTI
jgi:hypothetical protein